MIENEQIKGPSFRDKIVVDRKQLYLLLVQIENALDEIKEMKRQTR